MTTAMWDPDVETLPRDRLAGLQGDRFARQVQYVYENSRFFRERFSAAGVGPRDVRGLQDAAVVPTYTKDDVRADRDRTGDPFGGLLCVPLAQLKLVIHSTGTSGKPTVYGLTAAEHEVVGDVFARSCFTAGIRPGDHVTMPGSIGWHGAFVGWDKAFEQMGVVKYLPGNMWQGGMVASVRGAFEGIEQISCLFVYSPEPELNWMRENGVDPRKAFPNLKLLWSAVDASPAKRQMLLDAFGVPLKNQYGSGDGFWMAGECPDDPQWTHVPEDRFLFEVLDPETMRQVPSGGTGLLHVSNLWGVSFPYLRYNMEDMVACDTAPCSCGRTSMRLRVRGRLAWSVTVRSGYVFSNEVETILWDIPAFTGADYQLVREREQPQETLTVRVARDVDAAATAAAETALGERFGVDVRIETVAGIESTGAKAARVASR